MDDWAWAPNVITACATLVGVAMTLYFTGRRSSGAALFARYDELSSETREAIADYAESFAALGDPSSDLADEIGAWANSQDGDPTGVLRALGKWHNASMSALSKGLIAQMMCPEEELSGALASARGALAGDDEHLDYPGELWVLLEAMIRNEKRPNPYIADAILATFMQRMAAARAELNGVVELARQRLNDPAPTQKWVSHRIDERSNKLWAKARVIWRKRFGSEEIPTSRRSPSEFGVDAADVQALGYVAAPLTREEVKDLFDEVHQ